MSDVGEENYHREEICNKSSEQHDKLGKRTFEESSVLTLSFFLNSVEFLSL